MISQRIRKAVLPAILLLLAQAAAGQTVTGTISGTVMDSTNQVIVGARATLTSEATQQARSASTNEVGAFVFAAVPPGEYSLRIEASGFKTFQRTNVMLSANERLSLGEMQMTLGSLSETVTVTAEGAAVQTSSAEQSAMLTPSQMSNMLARGRDVIGLLRVLPGVRYGTDPVSLGGSYGTDTPEIGGAPRRAPTP